jgi:hypothetical protein
MTPEICEGSARCKARCSSADGAGLPAGEWARSVVAETSEPGRCSVTGADYSGAVGRGWEGAQCPLPASDERSEAMGFAGGVGRPPTPLSCHEPGRSLMIGTRLSRSHLPPVSLSQALTGNTLTVRPVIAIMTVTTIDKGCTGCAMRKFRRIGTTRTLPQSVSAK